MISVCPYCQNEPLVGTFAFRGKEYICLGCGMTFTFFGPPSHEATKELASKRRDRDEEWDDNGAALMVDDFKRVNCDQCRLAERHQDHATRKEWDRHNAAVKWLTERTGRDFTNLLVVPA